MPDQKPGGKEPSDEELEKRLQALLGESAGADSPEDSEQDQAKLAEINRRFEETRAGMHEKADKIDDEFEERLKNLEQRANAVKRAREQREQKTEAVVHSSQEDARSLALGLSIAYTIVGMPLMGTLVGWLIDRQVGTHYWMGMCTLAGATVGVAVSIMKMNRGDGKS